MKNRFFIIAFIAGLILNVSGYFIADFIKGYARFPLFLDTTGTIFTGVILGPVMGALTGFTSNLILGVVHNPVNIPFSIVNIIIGLAAGFIAQRYGFSGIKGLLISIAMITVLSALSGAIVASYVFGGATGAKIDLNIIKIMNSGYRLLTSSFLVRLPVNLLDKGTSIIIAYLIIGQMKDEYRGFAVKK